MYSSVKRAIILEVLDRMNIRITKKLEGIRIVTVKRNPSNSTTFGRPVVINSNDYCNDHIQWMPCLQHAISVFSNSTSMLERAMWSLTDPLRGLLDHTLIKCSCILLLSQFVLPAFLWKLRAI